MFDMFVSPIQHQFFRIHLNLLEYYIYKIAKIVRARSDWPRDVFT